MTDNILLPGFAKLLAFVFLNVSFKNYYEMVKNRWLLFPFNLKRKGESYMFL